MAQRKTIHAAQFLSISVFLIFLSLASTRNVPSNEELKLNEGTQFHGESISIDTKNCVGNECKKQHDKVDRLIRNEPQVNRQDGKSSDEGRKRRRHKNTNRGHSKTSKHLHHVTHQTTKDKQTTDDRLLLQFQPEEGGVLIQDGGSFGSSPIDHLLRYRPEELARMNHRKLKNKNKKSKNRSPDADGHLNLPNDEQRQNYLQPKLASAVGDLNEVLNNILDKMQTHAQYIKLNYTTLSRDGKSEMIEIREELRTIAGINDKAYDVILDISNLVRSVYLRAYRQGQSQGQALTQYDASLPFKQFSRDVMLADQVKRDVGWLLNYTKSFEYQNNMQKRLLDSYKAKYENRSFFYELDDLSRLSRGIQLSLYGGSKYSVRRRVNDLKRSISGFTGNLGTAANWSDSALKVISDLQKITTGNNEKRKQILEMQTGSGVMANDQPAAGRVTSSRYDVRSQVQRVMRSIEERSKLIDRVLVPVLLEGKSFVSGKGEKLVFVSLRATVKRLHQTIYKIDIALDRLRIHLGNDEILQERCHELFTDKLLDRDGNVIKCDKYGYVSGSGDGDVDGEEGGGIDEEIELGSGDAEIILTLVTESPMTVVNASEKDINETVTGVETSTEAYGDGEFIFIDENTNGVELEGKVSSTEKPLEPTSLASDVVTTATQQPPAKTTMKTKAPSQTTTITTKTTILATTTIPQTKQIITTTEPSEETSVTSAKFTTPPSSSTSSSSSSSTTTTASTTIKSTTTTKPTTTPTTTSRKPTTKTTSTTTTPTTTTTTTTPKPTTKTTSTTTTPTTTTTTTPKPTTKAKTTTSTTTTSTARPTTTSTTKSTTTSTTTSSTTTTPTTTTPTTTTPTTTTTTPTTTTTSTTTTTERKTTKSSTTTTSPTTTTLPTTTTQPITTEITEEFSGDGSEKTDEEEEKEKGEKTDLFGWWWNDDPSVYLPVQGSANFKNVLAEHAQMSRKASEELARQTSQMEEHHKNISSRWTMVTSQIDDLLAYKTNVSLALMSSTTLQSTSDQYRQNALDVSKQINQSEKTINDKILEAEKIYSRFLEWNNTRDLEDDGEGNIGLAETVEKVKVAEENMNKISDIVSNSNKPCDHVQSSATNLRNKIADLRRKIEMARVKTSSMSLPVVIDDQVNLSTMIQREVTPSTISSFSMCIKPSSSDMLLARLKNHEDLVTYDVFMEEGMAKVTARESKDGTMTTISTDTSLPLNTWSYFQLERNGHEFTFKSINLEEENATLSLPKMAAASQVPNVGFGPTVVHLSDVNITEHAPFIGCLSDVTVNGVKLSLANTKGRLQFCDTPLQHHRLDVSASAMVFTGDGYAKFPLTVLQPQFEVKNIRVIFQSKQRNGLILFMNDQLKVFQVVVALSNGSTHVEVRSPRGTTVSRSLLESYNNGSQHSLEIKINLNEVIIVLDGSEDSMVPELKTQEITSNFDDGIFVGGISAQSSVILGKQKLKPLIGCISSLEINRKRIPLYMTSESKNVLPGQCHLNPYVQCSHFGTGSLPIQLPVSVDYDKVVLEFTMVSTGLLVNYKRKDKFNIEIVKDDNVISVTDTENGISHSISLPGNNSYETIVIALSDDKEKEAVQVVVNGQGRSISYYSFWGFGKSPDYELLIGGTDVTTQSSLSGGIFSLKINNRPVNLDEYVISSHLGGCKHPRSRTSSSVDVGKPACNVTQ